MHALTALSEMALASGKKPETAGKAPLFELERLLILL
jgi:hypothetical protein